MTYKHPLERFEESLRDEPEARPGMPWRYVLGWSIVGLLAWSGIFWLVAKVIAPKAAKRKLIKR